MSSQFTLHLLNQSIHLSPQSALEGGDWGRFRGGKNDQEPAVWTVCVGNQLDMIRSWFSNTFTYTSARVCLPRSDPHHHLPRCSPLCRTPVTIHNTARHCRHPSIHPSVHSCVASRYVPWADVVVGARSIDSKNPVKLCPRLFRRCIQLSVYHYRDISPRFISPPPPPGPMLIIDRPLNLSLASFNRVMICFLAAYIWTLEIPQKQAAASQEQRYVSVAGLLVGWLAIAGREGERREAISIK